MVRKESKSAGPVFILSLSIPIDFLQSVYHKPKVDCDGLTLIVDDVDVAVQHLEFVD
jgi:hypothetical protein